MYSKIVRRQNSPSFLFIYVRVWQGLAQTLHTIFSFPAILSGPNLLATLQITLILSLPTRFPLGLAQTSHASFLLLRNPVWPKPPRNTPNPPDFILFCINSLWFGPDHTRKFPTFTQSRLAQTSHKHTKSPDFFLPVKFLLQLLYSFFKSKNFLESRK